MSIVLIPSQNFYKLVSSLTFESGISSNLHRGWRSLINPSIPSISSSKFRGLEIGYCLWYIKYFHLEELRKYGEI